jgi:hypothetical protein
VPADTRRVDDSAPDDLREELAALEAAETQLSAERRRLHQQIDFGFSTRETRARERKVSDERRRLHRRIDSLRELLQGESVPESPISRLGQWEGISPEIARVDNFGAEELEQ